MEDFLKQYKGKKIDISFGAATTVSGEVTDIKDGILYLSDPEDRKVFVVIGRIAAVWEADEAQSRPGFVG